MLHNKNNINNNNINNKNKNKIIIIIIIIILTIRLVYMNVMYAMSYAKGELTVNNHPLDEPPFKPLPHFYYTSRSRPIA